MEETKIARIMGKYHPIRIVYKETEKLKNTKVTFLFEDGSRVSNALNGNGIFTVGDVLDNWNMDITKCKRLGENIWRKTKAGVFAYMCELRLVDMKQEIITDL